MAALLGCPLGLGEVVVVVEVDGPLGRQAFTADDDRVPVDNALHAHAFVVLEAFDLGQLPHPFGRAGGDRLGDGVLGDVLQRARRAQHLVLGNARGRVARTLLSRTALERIGLALAGRTGARLAAGLGLPTSRNTLLRLVHALPDPRVGVVEVLGVDDFALRRGRRYATVLIDAVTHRRVDALPDRRAAPLTSWLRQHPGVKMACRDGSANYDEAVRQGAPDGIQTGDRGHLCGTTWSRRWRRP